MDNFILNKKTFGIKIILFILAPFLNKRNFLIKDKINLALIKLGPTYIKFGQFLATRPDIIGKDLANILKQLQDNVPTFSRNIAIAQLELSLNIKLNDVFSNFSEPVAGASIAQVHKATLKNGQKVAVKILRPNIEKKIAQDLSDFFFITHFIERFFPKTKRLRLVDVITTFKKNFNKELNLCIEAASISEMIENIAKYKNINFIIPKVNWNLTVKNILITNWITGVPLSNLKLINFLNIDMSKLAVNIVTCFLNQALDFGFFHADMHPGNILIKNNGQIALVDFGIMSRLNKKERIFLANILYDFVTGDYLHNAKIHFAAGYVPNHYSIEDFALALRVIGEAMKNRPAEEISMSKLLGQLLQTTEDFNMKTQLQLVMLQKNLLIVEGIARMLDPKFDMFKLFKSLLEDWLKKTLGIEARIKDNINTIIDITDNLSKLSNHIKYIIKNIEYFDKIAKFDLMITKIDQLSYKNNYIQMCLLIVVIIMLFLIFPEFWS